MFEKRYSLKLGKIAVVPLAGTWIEINAPTTLYLCELVVPLAGTWIEITVKSMLLQFVRVVPLAGTWIEIIGTCFG